MKKYELTSETIEFADHTLHRIRALVAFGDVVAGELGGFVEKESNLDQFGNAWVYGDAQVSSCTEWGVPVSLALGVVEVESNFDPEAVNPVSGCYGLMQLNPRYFPSGLTPEENINAGVTYLGELLERYDGDQGAALTAYNAGQDTGSRTYADAVLAAAERWAVNG